MSIPSRPRVIHSNDAIPSSAHTNPHASYQTPSAMTAEPEIIEPAPPVARNWYTRMMSGIGACLGACGAIPIAGCCCPNPYKKVEQGFTGLISEYGRYTRDAQPGIVYVNPITETIQKVDIRVRTQNLPQQAIFTKDNVNVVIDAVFFWRVIEPATAMFKVDRVESALTERAQTTLREVCGGVDLQEILLHRDQMASSVREIIGITAQKWGIEVESILIQDIRMDKDLQDNLSAAAIAKRQGASKVISAQAEVEAARLMREASDILNTPAAMQIRYLETLQKMASQSGSRVIFMPTHGNVDIGQGAVMDNISRM